MALLGSQINSMHDKNLVIVLVMVLSLMIMSVKVVVSHLDGPSGSPSPVPEHSVHLRVSSGRAGDLKTAPYFSNNYKQNKTHTHIYIKHTT